MATNSTQRGGLGEYRQVPHTDDGHYEDHVEKGFVKPKGSYVERRTARVLRFTAFAGVGALILLAFFRTASWDGEGSNNPGMVEPAWPGMIGPGSENQIGEVDEKMRHRYPTVTNEAGVSVAEAEKSNSDLFSSRKEDDRFQTYLILDKPVYKPGEFVRASCFILNALNNKLYSDRSVMSHSAYAIIKDPKGVQIDNVPPSELQNGVWGFQWKIPESVAGGDFKMEIQVMGYSSDSSMTSVERVFEVRATRVSNAKINKKLKFEKDSFSAGDSVKVLLTVDGDDVSTTAKFVSTVDGSNVAESEWISVVDGQATFSFSLPSKILRGEGVIAAKVKRGPLLESTTKTIPIVTQMLDLGVFPEGGVLVNGIRQRVYVEGLDGVSGKPADFTGLIYSDVDTATPLAQVISNHEGRGVSSEFEVPTNAAKVYLKLTSPSSVVGQIKQIPLRSRSISLPGDLVSISTPRSVFQGKLNVNIRSKDTVTYRIGIFKRDVKLQEQSVTGASNVEVVFDLGKDQTHFGVLRLTLFNPDGLPLAERLVFRMPTKALEIELASAVVDDIAQLGEASGFKAHKLETAPADGVAVMVRTWMRSVDETTGELTAGRTPVEAVVALRVTDTALAATVDKRLLPPRLPSAILLEPEVDRLHDAETFLPRTEWGWHQNNKDTNVGTKRKITYNERLDLLLGTQGWRMFAYYDAKGFLNKGKAPLLVDRLVPVGDKATLDNQQSMQMVREAASSSSPVSKIGIQRMMGITPQQQSFMYATAAAGGFAKRNRGGPQVMMAMAPQMQAVDVRMERMQDDGMVADAVAMPMMAEEAAEAAIGAPGNADFDAPVEPPNAIQNDEADGERDDVGMEAEQDDQAMEDEMDIGANMNDVRVAKAMWRPPPVVQRIYAHPQRKYLKKEFESGPKRADFTETVYFNPSLVTVCDAGRSSCEAKVSFGLSEASTATFVVHADGISGVGKRINAVALGASHMFIDTSIPLEVDFSLPSIIVNGDKPSVPITLQTKKQQSVDLKALFAPVTLLKPKSARTFTVEQPSAEGSRIYFHLTANTVVRGEQEVNLTIHANAEGGERDAVTRSTIVMPRGFPASQFKGGVLKTKEPNEYKLEVPKDYVGGSLQVSVRAYTSPVGRLTKALEELIREPCGCFEQTSSTTYPLVFVLQYLKTHSGSSPVLIKKATEMLQKGYEKLAAYESPGGGFEWFGGAPGHEALTAYGLLQFAAMSHPTVGLKVDQKMIERTKQWMNTRRNGKGGFLRNDRALDSFGAAPELTTNAYITWALVKAGLLRSNRKDPEVESIVNLATKSSDPYIVALGALALFDATEVSDDMLAQAKEFAEKLVSMQDENDGALRQGAADTITRSRGEALEIESTALGVLVWLHDSKKYAANARRAVDFLASKCKNGRFASTQATALSLMAIVEFDKAYSKPLPAGKVELLVDGKVVETLRFTPSTASSPKATAEDEARLSQGNDCKDGAVWTDCGTACPLTCEKPEPGPCTKQCVPRCQCPSDKPFETATGSCVANCKGTKSDVDSEGIMSFSTDKIVGAIRAAGGETIPHNFALRMVLDKEGTEEPSIPYSFAFKYSVLTPVRSEKLTKPHVLQLAVALDPVTKTSDAPAVVGEGEVVTIRAKVKNVAKEADKDLPVPLVVAVIGIPGGFEPRVDQLRELKDSKVVDFVESKPGQVILYWRAMAPAAEVDVPIQVVATIPGTYESPASRAYLYYNDEDKVWSKGFSVIIESSKADGTKTRHLFW